MQRLNLPEKYVKELLSKKKLLQLSSEVRFLEEKLRKSRDRAEGREKELLTAIR